MLISLHLAHIQTYVCSQIVNKKKIVVSVIIKKIKLC